ncbi:hypothetical protein niasHT_015359 [Heterodera trifolii]|uniref:Secreted protein n=1 Tax=Heterodera trifolii TaxID=157864 RepID=A0ABD2KZP5_9BILA
MRFSSPFFSFLLLLFIIFAQCVVFLTDAQRAAKWQRKGKGRTMALAYGGQRQRFKMPTAPLSFAPGGHRNGRRRIGAIPQNLLFPPGAPGTPQAMHGSLGAIWTNGK